MNTATTSSDDDVAFCSTTELPGHSRDRDRTGDPKEPHSHCLQKGNEGEKPDAEVDLNHASFEDVHRSSRVLTALETEFREEKPAEPSPWCGIRFPAK